VRTCFSHDSMRGFVTDETAPGTWGKEHSKELRAR